MNTNIVTLCYNELVRVRLALENKYGRESENMMGKCIEGSDKLVELLKRKRINARAYQVWALYENYESCLSCCYEEHWIVLVEHNGSRLYLDPTFNQFQWAIYERTLPKVYIGATLPNWLLSRRPGREVLKRCGWTDYYNGRQSDNDFDYWSYLFNPHNVEIRNLIKNRGSIYGKS